MQSQHKEVAASFVSTWLATTTSYTVFHPLSTIVDRCKMYEEKITLENFKRVAFHVSHDQDVSRKIQSLFSGSVVSLTTKLFSRTLKYSAQPPIAEMVNSYYGETATQYFGQIHGLSLMHAMAGGAVGALEVLFFHPLSTLKTKRQINDYRSIPELLRSDKFKSFYNGYGLSFAKTIPSTFVLFGTNQGVMSYYGIANSDEAELKHHVVAASAGVIMGSVVTNPQDVLIKRAQSKNVSVRAVTLFKEVVKKHGVKGLYRGIVANTLVSLPKKAAPFALYNFFMNKWHQLVEAENTVSSNNQRVTRE